MSYFKDIKTQDGVDVIKEYIKSKVYNWKTAYESEMKESDKRAMGFIYERRNEISEDDLIYIAQNCVGDISSKEMFDFFLDKSIEKNIPLITVYSHYWRDAEFDKQSKYLNILNEKNSLGFRSLAFFWRINSNDGNFLLLQHYKKNFYKSLEEDDASMLQKIKPCEEFNKFVIKNDFNMFMTNALLTNDEKKKILNDCCADVFTLDKIKELRNLVDKKDLLKIFLEVFLEQQLKNKVDSNRFELTKELFKTRNPNLKQSIEDIILSDKALHDGYLNLLANKEKEQSYLHNIIIDEKNSLLVSLCLKDDDYFSEMNREIKMSGVNGKKNLLECFVDLKISPPSLFSEIYLSRIIKNQDVQSSKSSIAKFAMLTMNVVGQNEELINMGLSVLSKLPTKVIENNIEEITWDKRSDSREHVQRLLQTKRLERKLSSDNINNKINTKIKI